MLREALKTTGRGLHIHMAEDRYDVSHSHHHYGKDLLVRPAEFDLIDSKTLVAHGLYLSEADIELLNAHDGFLVHNARSNMNNHVGYNQQLTAFRNRRWAPTASAPICLKSSSSLSLNTAMPAGHCGRIALRGH